MTSPTSSLLLSFRMLGALVCRTLLPSDVFIALMNLCRHLAISYYILISLDQCFLSSSHWRTTLECLPRSSTTLAIIYLIFIIKSTQFISKRTFYLLSAPLIESLFKLLQGVTGKMIHQTIDSSLEVHLCVG